MIYKIRPSQTDTPSIPADTLVEEPPPMPHASEGPTVVKTGVRTVTKDDGPQNAAPEGSWCVLRPLGADIGEPLLLSHGVPVERFTVGSAGTWRLVGDDILDVHALICFNGRSVFVWSVDWTHPVLVDEKPALGEWVELPEACIVRLGSIAIACTQLHPEHVAAEEGAAEGPPSTQRLPLEAPPADAYPTSVDPPREAPQPVVSKDDEPTRIGVECLPRPVNAEPARISSETRAQPKDDEPSRLGVEALPKRKDEEPTRIGIEPLPAKDVPTTTSPERNEDTKRPLVRLARKRVSRAWLVGIVAAMVSAGAIVGLVAALERAQQTVTPLPARPVEPAAPEPTSSDDPPPQGIVVSTAAPQIAAPAATADAGARPRRTSDGGVVVDGPSLERAAVDAIQAGDLRTALTLYEKLAEVEPGNPAFASAAAMLRRRMDPTSPHL